MSVMLLINVLVRSSVNFLSTHPMFKGARIIEGKRDQSSRQGCAWARPAQGAQVPINRVNGPPGLSSLPLLDSWKGDKSLASPKWVWQPDDMGEPDGRGETCAARAGLADFRTTHWSLVLTAGGAKSAEAQQALA